MVKFTLVTTRRCNLNCDYCYVTHRDDDLDLATAKQAVDLAVHLANGEDVDFGFFGGEPLLKIGLIREILPYLRRRMNEKGVTLDLTMTTNGTLMTPATLEFLAREQFALLFSIDGPPEIFERQRGEGVHEQITSALETARGVLDRVAINAVYGPETLNHLPETVRYLSGFDVPIYLNWDITSTWREEDLTGAEEAMLGVARIYMERVEQGRPLRITPLENKLLSCFVGGAGREQRCRMGEGEFAVDVDGRIFPCERLIDEESFVIGSLRDGLDEQRRLEVVAQQRKPPATCEECSANRFCTWWCGCSNWSMTGQSGEVHPAVCVIERATLGAVQTIWDRIHVIDGFQDYLLGALMRQCQGCSMEE